MADSSEYGTSPRPYRIERPRGFLPLNDESSSLSTRGQTLPVLLQSHSASAIGLQRRRSSALTFRELGDEEDGRLSDSLDPNDRRHSVAAQVLQTPQMRSMRLIGNNNPRYKWERYWKTEAELKTMRKPIREYYKRTNSLVQHYKYIDKLLDSSLPHNLIGEYDSGPVIVIPPVITEESPTSPIYSPEDENIDNGMSKLKIKRTPRAIYRVPHEQSPLLNGENEANSITSHDGPSIEDVDAYDDDEDSGATSKVVQAAIYINLAANTILLLAKIVVMALTNSLSVLASLVDGVLDFFSTAIVWTTTRLIARKDRYKYPIGRRRLEPIGVLVFSLFMVISFARVSEECFKRLISDDHSVVKLTLSAIIIMASTVVVKGACWFYCRLIKNSSVQALAQDAMTDVVFNTFSIIFPLLGFYLKVWWLDPLGGLLLSIYVVFNWLGTSGTHIRNLTGAAASADERNVLLYLTMRFAKSIKKIQGLEAYHVGDQLNVEVDLVLDEATPLRDSHDLGESLQYVIESVPFVDRAFVHLDYKDWNIPSHMEQQE